jgi:hypothetical protein
MTMTPYDLWVDMETGNHGHGRDLLIVATEPPDADGLITRFEDASDAVRLTSALFHGIPLADWCPWRHRSDDSVVVFVDQTTGAWNAADYLVVTRVYLPADLSDAAIAERLAEIANAVFHEEWNSNSVLP